MPKVEPFHTNSPEYPPTHRNVYHDNSECKFGKDIKSWPAPMAEAAVRAAMSASAWTRRAVSRRPQPIPRERRRR
jgi:hypothetical protein